MVKSPAEPALVKNDIVLPYLVLTLSSAVRGVFIYRNGLKRLLELVLLILYFLCLNPLSHFAIKVSKFLSLHVVLVPFKRVRRSNRPPCY